MAALAKFLGDSALYASAVLVLAAVLLFVYYLLRRRRERILFPQRDPLQDLAHIQILFQSMRDILEQQKELARELNKSVDAKIALVRETVARAREDVESMRREVAETAPAAPLEPEEPPRAQDEPLADAAEAAHETTVEETAAPGKPDALQVVPEPDGDGDLIDNWVGLDFAGNDAEPDPFDVPEVAPERPGQAEAAREAFRALLNLGLPDPARHVEAPSGNGSENPFSAENGNGRGKTPPLHAKVYEYSDAGMSVTEIASELGLGRGEVRLILNLRRERT